MADADEVRAQRLVRISRRLVEFLPADPEYMPGDTVVVMVGDDSIIATSHGGYADDEEAIKDLFTQLYEVCEHNGHRLTMIPISGN
jgi:hypothetical protein